MNLKAWMVVACAVVSGATMAACGGADDADPTEVPDAGAFADAAAPSPDAGSSSDAGSADAALVTDAGGPDGAVPTDAAAEAAPDAADAAVEPDAGPADAGADAAPIEAGPRHLVRCNTPQGSFTACNGANMAAEGVGSISYAAPTEVGSHLCDDSAPDVVADCATGDNCVVYIVATQTNDYGTCQ